MIASQDHLDGLIATLILISSSSLGIPTLRTTCT